MKVGLKDVMDLCRSLIVLRGELLPAVYDVYDRCMRNGIMALVSGDTRPHSVWGTITCICSMRLALLDTQQLELFC